MKTILPCVILLYISFVHASMLPVALNGTNIPTLDTCDTSSTSEQRTLWDIIWSCGVTLFAWTWTAIHPNIAGLNDSQTVVVGRRLLLMMQALFIPELCVVWAALQYFSARQTVKEFNSTILPPHRETISDWLYMWPKPWRSNRTNASLEWTMKHGFFAWMGGFMLEIGSGECVTLKPDELMRYIREGNVEMPKILDAEIADRSKRDGLSKAFATLQLAWFVLQFIARYFQNIQATLLEVDTLSIAALTCIAQFFWWDKPMNVRRPYIIHWKHETGPPPSLNNLFYSKEDRAFHSRVYLFFHPILSLAGIIHRISPGAIKARRVSSVGGYAKHHYGMISTLIGCFCGMLYGALHCLGWNYSFRTHARSLLWQWGSAVITISSAFFLLGFGYYELWSRRYKNEHRSKILAADVLLMLLPVFLIPTILIYVFGRILVTILTVLSLFSLPPSAYDTVTWTVFLPHL